MVTPQQRLPRPGQQQFRLPMQDGQSATWMTKGDNHGATLGTGPARSKPRFTMKGNHGVLVANPGVGLGIPGASPGLDSLGLGQDQDLVPHGQAEGGDGPFGDLGQHRAVGPEVDGD